MRTGLVIADFEMRFTTTFKHVAQVKYNVEFTNSTIPHIEEQLTQLKENMRSGHRNDVHVPIDFTVEDVENIEKLVNILVERYETVSGLRAANQKIYTLIQRLRDMETQTPEQIATKIIHQIVAPPEAPKKTRKERIKAEAEALSKQRALKAIQKNSSKKKG